MMQVRIFSFWDQKEDKGILPHHFYSTLEVLTNAIRQERLVRGKKIERKQNCPYLQKIWLSLQKILKTFFKVLGIISTFSNIIKLYGQYIKSQMYFNINHIVFHTSKASVEFVTYSIIYNSIKYMICLEISFKNICKTYTMKTRKHW